ncbi:FRG domain-containing protein [Acetobacter sp. AN02]|uniref:FRG domain-containing protein n=1 Tax=Acetobacter sp. AN02 TaxID=2894186 RepID=UPI0024345561|nr:FRG domain-containing protein [Acetobacter sp. AN02]MDG6093723.1 FRG domain-containing protein [Acetobacter sp. AN02]
MNSIKSVTDFVRIILGWSVAKNAVVTYRGHGSTDFKLIPSIFRKEATRENEHILLRELIAAHPEDFDRDTSALEMLVRMQHFSLPTRLLDVTMNPMVALYFACETVKKRVPASNGKTRIKDMDGHVVMLRAFKRRVRYFDSDTVSCLTNLARLSWTYKNKIDTGLELEEFNQSTPIKRLLHFVRQEKNGFLDEIEPSDLDSIVLVKPKQNNKRILAQAGAFFAFGLDEEIKSNSLDKIKVEHIVIPAGAKGDLLKELDKLGINEKTMFPDIERAARYITGTLSSGDAATKVLRHPTK